MTEYSADDIDWLRPPDVEGQDGDWKSRWLLATHRVPEGVSRIPTDIHTNVIAGELVGLGDSEVRLDLRTSTHPLDPDGYLAVDEVLRWVDSTLVLSKINGSPMNKWRTFR